ncbi:MAG: family 1 glycosylhydrolase [Actinomycetes bacterium]
MTFPTDFLWGTATAAHQVEGGNWNNDWWAWEHTPGSPCEAPSGDACDQWHRYEDDLDLMQALGFGAYRFSLEWSRIEPEEGLVSRVALDHYRAVIDACHDRGLQAVVTLHHFSTPRWAAADGGWTNPAIVDRFRRYVDVAGAALGDRIDLACTINEPNVVALMGWMWGLFPPGIANDLDGYARATDHLLAAHRTAVEGLRSGPGSYPVGLTVSMSDWSAEPGYEDRIDEFRSVHEDVYLGATTGDDFIGVQCYSRTRVGEAGVIGPEPGVEVLDMGYEYWPESAEASIRHAIDVTGLPVYVTENGIGTHDDEQRIRYLRSSLEGVQRSVDAGLDVRGFFHWSLLDNFEWAFGYRMHFGIIGVDLATQARTVKPSGHWLAEVMRSGRIG